MKSLLRDATITQGEYSYSFVTDNGGYGYGTVSSKRPITENTFNQIVTLLQKRYNTNVRITHFNGIER